MDVLLGGLLVHLEVVELVDLLVPVHPWLSSGTSMQAPPVLMECLVPESSSISRISTLYYHHQYQRKLCTNAPAAAPVSGPVQRVAVKRAVPGNSFPVSLESDGGKGRLALSNKTDEFSEKFQRGGRGSFSIQKFTLQILNP